MTSSRRHSTRLALNALTLAALVLAACSADDTDPTSERTVAEQPAPTGDGSAGEARAQDPLDESTDTRTVRDWKDREITVPAEPLRVATIDVTPTMNLALLGIDPISSPLDMSDNFSDDFRRFVPDDTDIDSYEVVGFPAELNVEALAALEPELIIGFNSIEEAEPQAFDILTEIAPTVLYEFGNNADWRSRFHLEAEILGREAEADAFEQRYEDSFDLVADVGDQQFAAVRYEIEGGGTWRFELPDASIPGSVLQDAGMSPFPTPPDLGEANDNGSYIPDISGERLDLLQADLVIVQNLTAFGQDDPTELFGTNPLWPLVPAVQNDNVVDLPALVFNGGTYASAILTLEAVAQIG